MKTVVVLLLLCLCDPGRSDCQADCLSCSNILPKLLSFNTMECLFECTETVSPSFSWDLCHKTLSSPTFSLDGNMRKRSQEEADVLFPEEKEQMEGGLLLPIALQRLDLVTRLLDLNQKGLSGSQLSTVYDSHSALENEYEDKDEEQEDDDADVGETEGDDPQLSVFKRFGGFIKGRHGYRKLTSSGRSYQKRYGGFTGIRKSARKWNNQKRFSKFLKQYLGMTTRAREFNNMSGDPTQQNEV
ncbi:prepronociceptin [Nematolebias whitei]|uniref:prepronociceptin n=1 Tax=Nematolebias whitei TaxID=451745 RepID=UPI001899E1BE|nr:prepronociceptin [Nematolebias whitei]